MQVATSSLPRCSDHVVPAELDLRQLPPPQPMPLLDALASRGLLRSAFALPAGGARVRRRANGFLVALKGRR